MNISRSYLGTRNNSDIYQYVLRNNSLMEVHILTWGSTISKILLPFPDGTSKNVVLSYADWTDYLNNPLYSGSTLAPNAGRISDGILPIDGTNYQLSANEGRHNAHGGFHNASLQNWAVVDTKTDSNSCSITLELVLPDGLDGYPGNRVIRSCYTLSDDNALTIHYHATTDQLTYMNISNHSYFNLSGDFGRSALEQQLEIDSIQFVANDREHIPASVANCSASAFDFSKAASLSDNIARDPDNEQLQIAAGYNNAFLLKNPPYLSQRALLLKHSLSSYILELYTDAPSIVLYSGGFIGNTYSLSGGVFSSASCAIALEAQTPPDAPNFLPEYCEYTSPDHPFDRRIIYKFSKQS